MPRHQTSIRPARSRQVAPVRRDRAAAWSLILLLGASLLSIPALAQLDLGKRSDAVFGAAQPEFLPVEEAYPLGAELEGENALRLVWQMPAGYYLYQHAFRFQQVRDGATTALETDFPPAITREDEFFGRVQVYYDSVELTLRSDRPFAASELLVTSQGCADAGLCYPPRTQRLAVDSDGTVTETTQPATRTLPGSRANTPQSSAGVGQLLLMAAFAFIGGLILNLMPCVLPVLSLKALSFAHCPPQARHRHGWFYSAGVVCSFVLVAALLLTLRSAGTAIGWGFQLQSPTFVIALAYLFTVMGLSLSGLLQLGAGLSGAGETLVERGGHTGSFFTGALAVVVASPCTAPFMGAALGFALAQPAPAALVVFAALGAGMAAPMLLLSYSDAARRLLPNPGPWMETLRQALAFPLYATALWLFWVAGRQAGVDLMAAALLGALLLAFALWLWRGRAPARLAALACLLIAAAISLWRPAQGIADHPQLPAGAVAYSAERLARLRGAGNAVFVDVTADWCITCLANEKAVLSQDDVRAAFADHGVTYMVADWTDYDAEIAAFVASHGRSGIPLYVLYSGDGRTPPRVLPQLLRSAVVIEALSHIPRAPTRPAQVALATE